MWKEFIFGVKLNLFDVKYGLEETPAASFSQTTLIHQKSF